MSSKERSGLRRFAFNEVVADLNKVTTAPKSRNATAPETELLPAPKSLKTDV